METPSFNDFFEEEQNTKKKTTKKTTTRTTTNGNAETHEKIEETVTEETVTVIKRPITSFSAESQLSNIQGESSKIPLVKVDVPKDVKSNIPYGIPYHDENEKNPLQDDKNVLIHDQSISSYEENEGLLTKIKEEDENLDESSSTVKSEISSKSSISEYNLNSDKADNNTNNVDPKLDYTIPAKFSHPKTMSYNKITTPRQILQLIESETP